MKRKITNNGRGKKARFLRRALAAAREAAAWVKARRHSDSTYRLLFEANPLPMWIFDEKTLAFLAVNEAAIQHYGYSRQEFLAMTIKDIHPAENIPALLERMGGENRGAFRTGVWKHMKKAGTLIDIDVSLQPVLWAGRPARLVLPSDITERQRAEEALRKSEGRFRFLMCATNDWIWERDLATDAVWWNDAVCTLFGYSPDDVRLDQGWWADRVHPEDVNEVLGSQKAAIDAGKGLWAGEYRFRRADGSYAHVFDRVYVIRDQRGEAVRMVGSVMDITDRKKTEESLRQLSGRLLRLQDEERRHIARELHDSTAQTLAGLAMNLTLVNDAATFGDKERKLVSDGLLLAEQCTREVRTLSYLLHPPLLDEVGLASALRWYTKGFADRSGVRVAFETGPELGRLPPETETTLFRVVQECLSNIHRHSGSATARIHIERHPTEITLEVGDEGKGMSPEVLNGIRGAATPVGVGVAGMLERLRQLGGRLEIDSSRRGTTVRAVLPVE